MKYSTHLKVGDKAPIIEAKEQTGLLLESTDLLELGKLVVVFYRGVWCPFCNEHLKHVEEEFLSILNNDTQVLLITPEQPPFVEEMMKKTSSHYPIISDDDYKIMYDYGVAFEVDSTNYKDFMAKESMMDKIKQHNNEDAKLVLPVPATFLIGQDNVIEHIHFNPNFKKRMAMNDIIDKL